MAPKPVSSGLQELVKALSPTLPSRCVTAGLVDQLAEPDGSGLGSQRDSLCRVYAILAGGDRLERSPDDKPALDRLSRCLASRYLTRPEADTRDAEITLGEVALAALAIISETMGHSLDDDVLKSLVPYTDQDVTSRSSPRTAEIATRILEEELRQGQRKSNFITGLLDGYIRRHLSNYRSSRLTASGRRLQYEEPSTESSSGGHSRGQPCQPPWRGDGAHLISTFKWLVKQAEPTLVEKHWPQFMPLLLGLLDDTETDCRVQGLQIAANFIKSCPSHLLRDRGIGTLLQETMLPTLQFLPSTTPEEESVKLLGAAYPALIQLSRCQFDQATHLESQRRFLDVLLREGVFLAVGHSGNYASIMELLANQTAVIIQELGMHAAKHLKDIVPMCVTIMVDPFMASQPSCLAGALDELKAAMVCCWPRLSAHYMGDVVKALSFCWFNLSDFAPAGAAAKSDIARVETQLREVARLAAGLAAKQDDGRVVGQLLGPLLSPGQQGVA